MWQAAKPQSSSTRITILAASHYGLPAEYDDYFHKIVIPAFHSADMIHFEGAGGREDEPRPVCDAAQLDDQGRKTLEHARTTATEIAIAVHKEIYRRASIPDTAESPKFWANLYHAMDEFELIEEFNLNLIVMASFSQKSVAPTETNSTVLRENVAAFLLNLKPHIQVRDLDTRYGARRAYCGAGKERIKLLISFFNSKPSGDGEIENEIPNWNREFLEVVAGEALSRQSPWMTLTALDSELLCQRNAMWVKELTALNDGRHHFVVAGAQHIHDISNNNAHCDGLLTGLRKASFVLREINSSGQ
jgi:hypothetical protein